MSGLSLTTRSVLHMYGVTSSRWVRYWYADSVWRGDSCGCPDAACIGVHHVEGADCRCLRFGLRGLLRHSAHAA